VIVDVTPAFAGYFARNRVPYQDEPRTQQPSKYGVSATLDDGVIDLELRFLADSAYCCYEWGCHLTLSNGTRWDWLRRELATREIPTPDRLELRLVVTIEAGAFSTTSGDVSVPIGTPSLRSRPNNIRWSSSKDAARTPNTHTFMALKVKRRGGSRGAAG
jgi:hypothetical protein